MAHATRSCASNKSVLSVDRFRPQITAARVVNELHSDTQPRTGCADAAAHRNGRIGAALGVGRQNTEVGEFREVLNDFFPDAQAEVFGIRPAAVIREGQHADRVLIDQPCRDGAFRDGRRLTMVGARPRRRRCVSR